MNLTRLSLASGALQARGTCVIIDVFRAFTCEPLMYHYGAKEIILEPEIARCLELKSPSTVLVGEHNELPLEGFDLTNSPWLIMKKGREFFEGKTVIHRTTSGVTGAGIALEKAGEVLLASYVNAAATARYIKIRSRENVSIVAMGIRSMEKAPEDELCGDYIESLLTGGSYDHIEAVKTILAHETAGKFLRGDKPYLPKEDPSICLQADIFPFALKAERKEGLIRAEMIQVENSLTEV